MHTDETNLIDKHQFKSRQRTGIRTEATLIQHKVPLYTFDSKAIIISEFYTIVLSTLNMNYSLCHTIVLELNSQQSDAITHTILEDKLRFEIKTEPVTLMESSISFNFKTAGQGGCPWVRADRSAMAHCPWAKRRKASSTAAIISSVGEGLADVGRVKIAHEEPPFPGGGAAWRPPLTVFFL